ncbi:hypothetical protein Tco_0922854 [Tanacetum coccineum]|uniref:Uncharacterized protein n=1 Tax=Tanacetum coccineum TaxID=301880 RepID=A0ABQ5CZB4_9ASTR
MALVFSPWALGLYVCSAVLLFLFVAVAIVLLLRFAVCFVIAVLLLLLFASCKPAPTVPWPGGPSFFVDICMYGILETRTVMDEVTLGSTFLPHLLDFYSSDNISMSSFFSSQSTSLHSNIISHCPRNIALPTMKAHHILFTPFPRMAIIAILVVLLAAKTALTPLVDHGLKLGTGDRSGGSRVCTGVCGVAPGFNLVGLPLGAIFLNHKKT